MKGITGLVIGLGVGAAAGIITGAAYMKKKMSEAIDEIVDEEVKEFIDSFNRKMSEEPVIEEEAEEPVAYNSLHPDTSHKPAPSTLFRDRAMEHPEEPQEESDILEENPIRPKEDIMKEPKLISEDKYDDDQEFDKETLYYYQDDDILTDEEENEIDNQLELVGDTLDKFGFRDNDEVTVHVRNFEKKTDYEVIKLFTSYRE